MNDSNGKDLLSLIPTTAPSTLHIEQHEEQHHHQHHHQHSMNSSSSSSGNSSERAEGALGVVRVSTRTRPNLVSH